jgi:two-component system, chemotaxis family, protein-glutamate methylesterase/glutaminase
MKKTHVLPGGTPRSRPWELIVLAASAGGLEVLQTILAALPAGFPVPIVVLLHRSTRRPYMLPAILQRVTSLEVVPLTDEAAPLRSGHVYLTPPDRHVVLQPDRTFATHDGRRIRHVLSSANPLLESAARVLGEGVIAVILTGYGSDGTDGVQAVKANGGLVIAQDERTAFAPSMPASAAASGAVDLVLAADAIGPALVRLTAPTASHLAGQERQVFPD